MSTILFERIGLTVGMFAGSEARRDRRVIQITDADGMFVHIPLVDFAGMIHAFAHEGIMPKPLTE
jgi:hypothetical protein